MFQIFWRANETDDWVELDSVDTSDEVDYALQEYKKTYYYSGGSFDVRIENNGEC